MSKFIVYDCTEKDKRLVEFDSFTLKENWIYLELKGKEVLHASIDDVQICEDIEPKDINGKSIYADSSIVNFIFPNNKRHVYAKGYFTYDNKKLAYKIFDVEEKKFFNYSEFKSMDIETIDTIQENKLGLINEK